MNQEACTIICWFPSTDCSKCHRLIDLICQAMTRAQLSTDYHIHDLCGQLIPVTKIAIGSMCQGMVSVTFFFHIQTHYHTPLIISFIYINHTHTRSQVIGHSHMCHITHHTLSHHGLHHHDIMHDSHSLSMTSFKIQTRPTSNSVINQNQISNHPLSLIKILIRSNPHQLR
jgi:hypothetical protein